MNVYIWEDPLHIDYGGSCLIAHAETEEQARDLAEKERRAASLFEKSHWRDLFPLGPPTKVIEGAGAFLAEWAE